MTEVHLLNNIGTACAACGDLYVAGEAFVLSRTYWNTLSDRCVPDKIMTEDMTLIIRSPDRDNQTAAMKEDHKNVKRQNQRDRRSD